MLGSNEHFGKVQCRAFRSVASGIGQFGAWGLFGRRNGIYAALQARFDELVKITVEHAARVAGFNAGTQVLHARLIKHVAADLVTQPMSDFDSSSFVCASMRLRISSS